MKDIDIIVPVHQYDEEIKEMMVNAIGSVYEAQKLYTHGKLRCLVVYANEIGDTSMIDDMNKEFEGKIEISFIKNEGETDYCSQVNLGVENVTADFFSILEFDDAFTPKWFETAHKYFYGNESISVFLPINLFHDGTFENWQYGNTMAISPMFITADEKDTDEIGIINFMRLEKCSLFNITGSIFNTKDFKTVGMYKPSIQVAFNYEFLLRLTKLGLKAMVIPKEGYIHGIGRKNSLTEYYTKEMTEKEREKWFNLALRECVYKEDRKKDVNSIKEEVVK